MDHAMFLITVFRHGPKVVAPRSMHCVKETDTFADLYERSCTAAEGASSTVDLDCVWGAPTESFKASDKVKLDLSHRAVEICTAFSLKYVEFCQVSDSQLSLSCNPSGPSRPLPNAFDILQAQQTMLCYPEKILKDNLNGLRRLHSDLVEWAQVWQEVYCYFIVFVIRFSETSPIFVHWRLFFCIYMYTNSVSVHCLK